MSTRRVTRSASRASSRGLSPTASEVSTTPRRTGRSTGGTPLPAVNIRASTAYGTNTVPAIAGRGGQPTEQEIGNVLDNILQPVPEEREDTSMMVGMGSPSRGKGSAQRQPAGGINQSFADESNLFKGAAFDSSSIGSQDRDLGAIPTGFTNEQVHIQHAQPSDYDELALEGDNNGYAFEARTNTARPASVINKLPPKARKSPPKAKGTRAGVVEQTYVEAPARSAFMSAVRQKGAAVLDGIYMALSWILAKFRGGWFLWLALICILAIFLSPGTKGPSNISAVTPETSYQWYGFNLRHNIGQFIPDFIAHPTEKFGPEALQTVQADLRDLDYRIQSLSIQTNIDSKTIAKIEKALPNFLLLETDKNGAMQIPPEFWYAVRDLIQKDNPITTTTITTVTKDLPAPLSVLPDVSAEWVKFVNSNAREMEAWSNQQMEYQLPRIMKSHILASKDVIIGLIQKNWDENHADIKDELQTLTHKISDLKSSLGVAFDQLSHLHKEARSRNRDEIQYMISEYIEKTLPIAQLQALANANLNKLNNPRTKVNHFSHGTGAVIDPHLTSSTYTFPAMRKGAFEKFIRRNFMNNPVPAPNPPEAALTRWDEHGDCWCSPSNDDGYGTTIGVIMGNRVYPEEVVIEHVAPNSSLEPGAAPREMELLAYLGDMSPEDYDRVAALSKQLFPGQPDVAPRGVPGYIRIAMWRFDVWAPTTVQGFPVQLDLTQFLGHTDRLVVRAKNNHGGMRVDHTCMYRIKVHGRMGVAPAY